MVNPRSAPQKEVMPRPTTADVARGTEPAPPAHPATEPGAEAHAHQHAATSAPNPEEGS